MTWHTEVVPEADFEALLGAIRRTGGTVTNSSRCPTGYCITYVTHDE